VLRAPNGRVATFGDDLKQLAAEMFEVMYQDDGVGLAAPQVGVNVRLMVFNPEGVRGSGREYVLANPRIISTSNTTERGEEGCLSFITDKGLILGDVDVSLALRCFPCARLVGVYGVDIVFGKNIKDTFALSHS
jgi:peptide deformylase